MAILASNIITASKGLLNDPQGAMYPDAALLPLVSKAYRELQIRLSRAGMGATREVSERILVLAGTQVLGDGSGLPTGFLYPVEIKEGQPGAPIQNFFRMTETTWELSAQQTSELRVWSWREEELKFIGATVNREILVHFVKGLVPLTSVNDPIYILNSELFLEARTAAIAAAVLGENYSRADALNVDAEKWYDVLVGTLTKRGQRMPVRRLRTRYRV